MVKKFSELRARMAPDALLRSEAMARSTLAEMPNDEPMRQRAFASVWNAIEGTPGDAQVMKLRSALMAALRGHLAGLGPNSAQAARRLGVTPSRMNELMRGRIDRFELEALVGMAAAAGLHVEMQVGDAD